MLIPCKDECVSSYLVLIVIQRHLAKKKVWLEVKRISHFAKFRIGNCCEPLRDIPLYFFSAGMDGQKVRTIWEILFLPVSLLGHLCAVVCVT